VTAPEHTVVGVDVGGTKVAAALLRGRLPAAPAAAGPPPELLARAVVPTRTESSEACLESITEAARTVLAQGPAEGVGIGVASMVEFAAGRVVASVNLPLADLPLRDLLQQRLALPVAVDNDATVAAIGEHEFGAGVGVDEMVMLTLGTGVGGGLILRGRTYRGASGAAGELGHIVVEADGLPCTGHCPNRGCLEAYVSGTALGLAAVQAARAHPASALGLALAAGDEVDARLLVRLAGEGDAVSLALLERAGERLGAGLVTLVNTFNPQLIVVGGGVAAAGELLLGPARRLMLIRTQPPQRDEVRVTPAVLGPDAGVIGAAALALEELF
jgi:glucokinase